MKVQEIGCRLMEYSRCMRACVRTIVGSERELRQEETNISRSNTQLTKKANNATRVNDTMDG